MCDNCTNMDTHVERVCCHDLTPCLNKLVEVIIEYNHVVPYMGLCKHPGFILNCLYREVLDNAWLSYKQQYGQNGFEDVNINKQHQHVAYRQPACFLFGIDGRSIAMLFHHVPLPILERVFLTQKSKLAIQDFNVGTRCYNIKICVYISCYYDLVTRHYPKEFIC